MMMSYGLFVFSLNTLPYQDMSQQLGWRHPANHRIGKRPARQFIGVDDETITLKGVLLPEITGGTLSLTALQLLCDMGKAWPLIEGTGKIYGLYVAESLQTDRTLFFKDGAARRIEFTLVLKRVEDNDLEKLGVLTGLIGVQRK